MQIYQIRKCQNHIVDYLTRLGQRPGEFIILKVVFEMHENESTTTRLIMTTPDASGLFHSKSRKSQDPIEVRMEVRACIPY